MLEVFPLFPQAIARIKYENHHIIKEKILDFINNNKHLEQTDGSWSPLLTHYFNNSTKERLDFFDCIDDEDFKLFLIDSSTTFVNGVLGNEMQGEMLVTDCWINNCAKNGDQRYHNHCNSFVSGTYYVNYDPENHSPLKFENPLISPTKPYMMLNTETITQFNHEESYCQFIEEGDLVLWQSFLSHGYEINKKDERISVSMNFVPSIIKSGPYTFRVQK